MEEFGPVLLLMFLMICGAYLMCTDMKRYHKKMLKKFLETEDFKIDKFTALSFAVVKQIAEEETGGDVDYGDITRKMPQFFSIEVRENGVQKEIFAKADQDLCKIIRIRKGEKLSELI